jgi:sorbitol/mannitol transport system substrate-binding protein
MKPLQRVARVLALVLISILALVLVSWAAQAQEIRLTIATVNNPDVILMQPLSRHFEAQNPHLRLEWVVLEENVLRQRVTADLAASGSQFDVPHHGHCGPSGAGWHPWRHCPTVTISTTY